MCISVQCTHSAPVPAKMRLSTVGKIETEILDGHHRSFQTAHSNIQSHRTGFCVQVLKNRFQLWKPNLKKYFDTIKSHHSYCPTVYRLLPGASRYFGNSLDFGALRRRLFKFLVGLGIP